MLLYGVGNKKFDRASKKGSRRVDNTDFNEVICRHYIFKPLLSVSFSFDLLLCSLNSL